MATSKHFRQDHPSDADLKGNPGIGTSSGRHGQIAEGEIQGENTEEGDVLNDTLPSGGVDPNQRGRGNK
ncbi:MAG: hypothetical protein ACK4QP_06175 [Pseudorhizobium sp.]